MQFGDAVTAMKNGLSVYRPAWDERKELEPGRTLKIERVQNPEAKGGESPVIMEYNVGAKVGTVWGVGRGADAHADLFAEDWEIRQ